MTFAAEHARRAHSGYVHPECLVLGCLDVADQAVVRMFSELGINQDEVRAQAEGQLRRQASRASLAETTPSVRTKRAIDLAFDLARQFEDDRFGVLHLLGGVIATTPSFLADWLETRGISRVRMIQAIRQARLFDLSKEASASISDGLSDRLTRDATLDILAVVTMREVMALAPRSELGALSELLADMDRVAATMPPKQESWSLSETIAESVHLATSRREPLLAVHLLAALYATSGSVVHVVGRKYFASSQELLDRLYPR